MKKLILFLCFSITLSTTYSQDVTTVKGQFSTLKFSKISLKSDVSPLTGTQDQFEATVLDSGKFEVKTELYVPQKFLVYIDETPAFEIFLCPEQNLTLTMDSSGYKSYGSTNDFHEWNKVLNTALRYSLTSTEYHGANDKDIKNTITYLFDLRDKDVSQLEKLTNHLALSPCEYTYFKNRVHYAIYTILWSELLQQRHPINSDIYQFLNSLPLDDVEAARSSLDYSRAINVYVFLKLRLEQKWLESSSFDPTSDIFNTLFYDKIITEIQNEEVRNVTLTNKVINLLNSGSTSAESLYNRYLKDCSDPWYKEIALTYYNNYKNGKNIVKQELKVTNLQGLLFDELKKHNGKVLYIDFWASWCAPCLQSLPLTKKLQEKYKNQPLEVIYVSFKDNVGNFKTAAKRMGLDGTLIYLDRKQSDEIARLLDVQEIPHYTLIDKEGTIVSVKAPSPDSGALEPQINELLEKQYLRKE